MNHSLVQTGGLLPSRLDRQVGRALAEIEASNTVAMRRDVARLDRISGTTAHAMTRAAHIGAMEASLAQLAPNAAGYVHAVAVNGVIGLAGVVADTSRGA
jgi:hypothetical protein